MVNLGAPRPAPKRRTGLIVGLAVGAALVLVALVVGAVVLLAGDDDEGSASGADEPDITFPEEWDPRIAELADWVADERDLEFEHPVEVLLLPEDEYRETAAGRDEDSEESDPVADEEEAQEAVALLRALGLVDGEVDLDAAGEAIASDGTLAYYSFVEKKVYVRGDELTPSVRVTLVHELTHVLQDQHFDLSRLADPDFEERSTLRALAEGDAGRIEDIYINEVLSGAERQEHAEASAEASSSSEDALGEVPPAFVTLFSAPYALGEGFVAYLEARDGRGAIDDALRDPPTEQELLDPAVRATPASVIQEVAVEAPEGTEILQEDTFGPLILFILLASRGDAADALVTTDGWGGDAMVSYRDGETVCAAVGVIGDDQPSTDRLQLRLASWAAAGPSGSAQVELVDGVVRLTSCDPGAEAPASGQIGPQLLVMPVLRASIEASLINSGATPDQATCASNQLLAELSYETLTDPGAALDPEVSARIQGIVLSCR